MAIRFISRTAEGAKGRKAEESGNAVIDLFNKMAADSPSDTAVLPGGHTLFIRDQYGTKISYTGRHLRFTFPMDAEEDLLLLAEGITQHIPMKIETSGDKIHFDAYSVSPEDAVETIKGVFEA